MKDLIDRRTLLVAAAAGVGATALGTLSACKNTEPNTEPDKQEPLPQVSPDPESVFGVDQNINIGTIDDWLNRDDVAYIDTRMFKDPAKFEEIGGKPFDSTIKGFKIVPFPYLATMTALPVDGGYTGPTAFSVVWAEDGGVSSATPNYEESHLILEDLFPKDKGIFLLCGGAGYSASTKALLTHFGWDPGKIYVVGAHWAYEGDNNYELVVYSDQIGGNDYFVPWRADYAWIPFESLHRV